MNKRFGLIVSLAFWVPMILLTLSARETPSPPKTGTLRMVERLKQIAEKPESRANPAIHEEAMNKARLKLAQTRDFVRELQLRMQLGEFLLLDGKSEEAAQAFLRLRERISEAKIQVHPEFLRRARDFLAVAYLRLGEQENCIAQHTTESCYLPIRKSGIHTIERGSREAIKVLTEALTEKPDDLASRWLLNLAYMTLGEHPDKVASQWLIPAKTFNSEYDIKRFHDVAPSLGLDAVGLLGGSIMEDFDGDGNLDIMASSWSLRDQLRYFRNNGNGTFSGRTVEAGLTGEVGGTNLCHADYNNDGYSDVLVLRGAWLGKNGHHPNSLLRNNGDGTFEDVTEEAGLLTFHPRQTAAWGDYNNDGWIDLFIGNESSGKEIHPCELFHNNGDGTFSERAASAGVANIGFVKGVAWGDYNNDGLQDLYLSRRNQTNVLYRNNGKGSTSGEWTFTDVSEQAGVTEPIESFPTWFWDYDNDGWLDIWVGGYSLLPDGSSSVGEVAALYLGLSSKAERPRLFRNNHDGTFTDVTRSAKLDRVLLAMGANFGDLDNDGFLDCYIGTGEPDFRTLVPNRMFRNAGGKFFQDVTTAGGFGHLQKGHGVSFGDIDNDGDQDIYAVIGGWYSGDVYQNVLFENPGHGNHWVTLKLEGTASNRSAIGARIKVSVSMKNGGQQDVYATVTTGGSFGSSLQQEIGLGQAASIKRIEIIWPATAKVQIFKNIPVDQVLGIREGNPTPRAVKLKSFRLSAPASDSIFSQHR